jgi:SPP1 family predicted phage head-tail adaptor
MIGELNQRVRILAQTLTPDGGGGYSGSWNVIATLWADVEPRAGSNVFAADALQSRVEHRVTIRRNAAVSVGMRVMAGTQTLSIHAMLDDGSPLVTLLCEAVP